MPTGRKKQIYQFMSEAFYYLLTQNCPNGNFTSFYNFTDIFLALYFHELAIIIKWPDLTNLKVLSAALSKPRNPYSVFQLAVLYRRFITPAKNRMQVCKAKLLDLIIPEGKLFDFAGVYRAKFKKKIKQFPFYWHIKKILIWKRGRFPDFENYDFLARLRLIHKTARNYFQDVRLKIKLLIIIGDGFKKIFK